MGGGISNSQSDWNTNDSESPAYIKNRPFYEETTTSENLTLIRANAESIAHYKYESEGEMISIETGWNYRGVSNGTIGNTYTVRLVTPSGETTESEVQLADLSSDYGVVGAYGFEFNDFVILFNVRIIDGDEYLDNTFIKSNGIISFYDGTAETIEPNWESCEVVGLASELSSISRLDEKFLPDWAVDKKNAPYTFEFDIESDSSGGYTATAREGATYDNIMSALAQTPEVYARCYFGNDIVIARFNEIGTGGPNAVTFTTIRYVYVSGSGYMFVAVRGWIWSNDAITLTIAPISTPTS